MAVLSDFTGLIRPLFIETGTGRGDTLSAAAKHFDLCLSIEQDAGLYLAAREKFEKAGNVRLYHGSSPKVLDNILSGLSWRSQTPATFWLDAHYTGDPETLVAYGLECPLGLELQAIVCRPWKKPPIILIDDAWMFDDSVRRPGFPDPFWTTPGTGHEVYDRKQWPRIGQIDAMLKGYRKSLREGVILQYEAS